jgi:hypothetical protein
MPQFKRLSHLSGTMVSVISDLEGVEGDYTGNTGTKFSAMHIFSGVNNK